MMRYTTAALREWLDWRLGVVVQIIACTVSPRVVVWTVRGEADDIKRLARYETDIVYAFGDNPRPNLTAVVEPLDSRHARIGVAAPDAMPAPPAALILDSQHARVAAPAHEARP